MLALPEPLVISVPGVDLWRTALPILDAVGARRVALAWDSDWRTTPRVAATLRDCARRLAARGLEVTIYDW